MASGWSKSIVVAAFSLVSLFFFNMSVAQGKPGDGEQSGQNGKTELKPSKVILEHIADAHEFHFWTFNKKPATIPLPVILYSPERGWSVFMFSRFMHGAVTYDNYRELTEEYILDNKLNEKAYAPGKIVAVDTSGNLDTSVKVYDLSLGRNAVQMLISVLLLIWIMTSVAAKYKKGQGVKSAPSGIQNVIEPVVVFIRDEVGKVNLGDRYEKYMPFLLTIFFFILINALIGLIPGTANVVGNIAFTAMLGILAFIAIMFSTGKHYWGHIVNPPVPWGVKPIMWPVEVMGIFTKPFALIVRLFANMISGHIIILSFIILIFVFGAMNTAVGWGTSPFFILLAVFIYLIEILVAFIQAYIFANLTALFIGQAFEGHEGGEGDEHGHDQEHGKPTVVV
jgi:F-type H+-transporting ATPase subunit a